MKLCLMVRHPCLMVVAPHAGAWIETFRLRPAGRPRSSPPTRGRGLKHARIDHVHAGAASPPTRGRGLKPSMWRTPPHSALVAPHAGAWIETPASSAWSRSPLAVAPHAGAWIETESSGPLPCSLVESPPTRGRGLKLVSFLEYYSVSQSPPTRGRGLKLARARAGVPVYMSPPTRGRGLKHGLRQVIEKIDQVAPHAGAWIETAS